MLRLGAAGETAEEIQKVLQLPADLRELINRQSNLISSLNNISSPSLGLKFVTGDAVFVTSKIRLRQKFKDHVAELGGEIDRADFTNAEAAAKRINAWLHSKTAGKIDKIVEAADLNDQISLLLLNTIYFKGSWENKFNKLETKKLAFSPNASCSLTVDMMTQENDFQFADLEDAKAQVILLPYKGGRLSMMIYLPFKRGNPEGALDTLENWLKDQSPFDIQTEYLGKPETVKVSLPKFKIRSSLQLNEPLQRLGLRKMFDAVGGNFSGIFNDSRNFFQSKVSQETFIEVDEEGTEATAVTGSELAATSITPDFTANRPFLFQIVDNTTKTVLFSGRVKNPLESFSNSSDGNSQCIEAGLKATEKCVAKPEVEEMVLDFLNLLAPNKTEGENYEINPSPVSGLEDFLAKYENETRGATRFLQGVNNTLKRLNKAEEKLEKPDYSQNSSEITPAPSGTLSENTTIIEEEPKSATAWGWGYAKSGQGPPRVQKYNVTVNGSCFDFNINIQSVHLTGSCVTLYREYDCGGQKFLSFGFQSCENPRIFGQLGFTGFFLRHLP